MFSVVLLVNTVIVATVAAICWRNVLSVLPSLCVSSFLFFLAPFPPPTQNSLELIIQSCIKGKANICLRYTFTDMGGDNIWCNSLT